MSYVDLFGNVVEENPILAEKYLEPPFSILDAKSQRWQERKRIWKNLGIKSEVGREAVTYHMKDWADKKSETGKLKGNKLPVDTSIFDPVVCELMYKWFCAENGFILDPFAGGGVRGIVANYLGYKYTGIDIRQEQVDANKEQAKDILPENNQPRWIVGDSERVLDTINEEFDLVFSCPPYFNLEVYSDLDGDISNLKDYNNFLFHYKNIINKSCEKLKKGGFACFVVGEIRDKKGNYIGFVPDTIRCFQEAKMGFYNEAILATSLASAPLRAEGNMKTKKLVKVHQNILIFKKGE